MTELRNDWSVEEVEALFDLPFNDLIFRAQTLHRETFNPNEVQISTLLSIKTGACPEDCSYCSQSAINDSGLERERLLELTAVKKAAAEAKANGSTRFCMGAAWRNPTDKSLDKVIDMITEVKAMGMETCVTLGMLKEEQAKRLKEAGLDYYNHNLDTSPEFYGEVITTRTYQDRIDTISHVRGSGINVCSGGILGMGETRFDRARLLQELANLPEHPGSVPINDLVQVKGTPLDGIDKLDAFEFIRTIAVARIMMPKSYVRLSAGRMEMNEQTQSLCFFAGANSMFYGDRLLTTDNPNEGHDQALFAKLGIEPEKAKFEATAEDMPISALDSIKVSVEDKKESLHTLPLAH
ncbi:biotin synthase BioB [Leucothrix arctica]|uniref:Biotin synthase n=1 Tax=Leucothrix arctica TaxID=1481894 RepID=A0A317C682_9GAMM|nr:biotin synthase BioB [Leucothrix arctica]PWQ94146.1 biotin synthase BioB [Leucothrix arctica]